MMSNNNLIPEKDLGMNANADFGLTQQLQAHLASQNAQFTIDLARDMKFGYSVPTLALHISTIFFHKKSYIHFDRLLILTASFLLASKLKNIDCRLKALCNSFYGIINFRLNGIQPFNEDKMKKLREYISIYENEILRTLEFDIDVCTPHDYLKKQCEILYVSERDVNRKIFFTTRILILDSYRTRCCLVYSPIIIFIACFLIASRYEGKKPWDNETVRNACKEENASEQKYYQTWLKMISVRQEQQISATAVRDCLRMINTALIIF